MQGEELLEFIAQAQQGDARGWIHEAIAVLHHENLMRLVVTLWAIWYARRKVIHEELFQSPLSTHSFVEKFLSELNMEKPRAENHRVERPPAPRWIPPPQGMMKINVDAALSKNSSMTVIAAVARDEAGIFQGASALVVTGVSSPEIAEALAGREGLALARDLGMQRITIASACVNVARSIQGPGMGLYGHIVREIKAEMTSFTKANFVYEGWNSNGDAHRIARSSIYNDVGRYVWFIDPPDRVCTSYSAT